LSKLEGDGGHLRLAGNWLELNLAEDSWELGDLLEEGLARQSTLFQRAGQSRWLRDADELNRLLLDGQWLGKAGLDHLLGDAKLGGLLVNNVGHAGWLVQDRDALVQLGDWGWDDGFTGALGGFTLELLPKARWKARETRAPLKTRLRARLVEHIGDGGQTWPHNTHAWGLQISRDLTVHVTAKTNSARLQELWGNNLNPGSIRQDLQALLWDINRDNIVLETLNHGDDLALNIFLDELLTNHWTDLFPVDEDLHGARGSWNDLGLSDARQNLDNLLLGARNSPGGDGHWDVLGAIQKEDMLTVIDLVFNSLVVKGADKGWLNMAGRWHAVASHLESNNFKWGVQPGGREDRLGIAHQAQVLQDNLPGWGLDLSNGDEVGGTLSTGFNQDAALNSSGKFLALNIANKESLGDAVHKGHEGRPGPGLWSIDGDVNLVKRTSLAADKGADWGKHLLAALLNHALLELWRLTDLPLQLFSLLKLSMDLDLLHVGGLTKGKLSFSNGPQWFLQHLLNVEPVPQFWKHELALKGEAIGLARDWGNLSSNHVRAFRLLAQNNDTGDLLQWRSRGRLGHASNLNNISLLKLRQDTTNVGQLRGDLVLRDLHLGQRVHHALGGKPENNVELLGLRPGWVVVNAEGRHLGRRWEEARWDDRKWGVLSDLLDVGVQVSEHSLRLILQLGRETKGLANFHFNWLPLDARGDLLQRERVSDWGDLKEVVLERVWHDENMEVLSLATRAHNLRWGPDSQIDFTTGDLAFNLNWDRRVEGHVNTRANELLGEWSDDTIDGLELAVQDWDNLGRDDWGPVAFNTRDLDGSLDSIDNWQSRDGHNWETSFSDKHVGLLKDLRGSNLVEFHLMTRLDLPGKLLKRFQNNVRVQVQGGFNSSPGAVQESEWSRQFPGLQLQFFGDLVQLAHDGWVGGFLSREEVQVLLQQEVHAISVGREFNSWNLERVGWAIVDSLHGKLVWDQRLLRVDQFILVVDKNPQVLNKGRDMDIVGVLDAKPLTLDEWQDRPGLQANSLELWNLRVSQRPQGGVDEGSNLLRWLHPRADGQLLELSSGWLGKWKNRNSSNPDLSRLNWVDNDGHKDWADFSWVHLSNALQSISGNGPAGLSHGDFGGRGSLEGSTFDLLDKGLESLQVTSLAQSKDSRKTDMLRLSPLNLFNKEWDELLSQDM